LNGHYSAKDYPDHLRRFRFKDPESAKTLIFLTNQFTFPALTIAALYKQRWQVELFFKWIKQHLRIKHAPRPELGDNRARLVRCPLRSRHPLGRCGNELLERLQELCARDAVDRAVIAGQREIHHQHRREGVVAIDGPRFRRTD
jgi:hypothetical protein